MNVRHPIGVLRSFPIKNIFYDKMDLRLFYFCMTERNSLLDADISNLGLLKQAKWLIGL